MSDRLDHQLDLARRTVRQLQAIQVQVRRVILDATAVRPVIETGPGPFAWSCTSFGQDKTGAYWHYSSRYNGIELRRTVRGRRASHGAR